MCVGIYKETCICIERDLQIDLRTDGKLSTLRLNCRKIIITKDLSAQSGYLSEDECCFFVLLYLFFDDFVFICTVWKSSFLRYPVERLFFISLLLLLIIIYLRSLEIKCLEIHLSKRWSTNSQKSVNSHL